MIELTPNDWDALQALAIRVGLPVERISLVRRRCEAVADRPGSPYSLLAGRPDGGLELLLARWLAPEAAEQLLQVGHRPLVIGPTPTQVGPRLAAWPSHVVKRYCPGHILALRTTTPPPADVLAQLGSLGHLDQLVVLTRLCQPLHQDERALARSLAALAATARVLIVAVPGEEPTENDLAEVTAYAVSQLRQAGFDGRCMGAGIWFTDCVPRPNTVPDVGEFLAVNPDEVAAGRRGMIGLGMKGLFAEIHRAAKARPTEPQANISDDECGRLTHEMSNFVADLGREIDRQVETRRAWTAESLRSYALDSVRGWGSLSGVEGHWLKYVERLRPGTQVALLEQAREAFALLDYKPGSAPNQSSEAAGTAALERLITEAKRLAVGLGLGLGAYLVVATLLGNKSATVALPALVVTLLCYAVLVIGTILGYGVGRLFFRQPQSPPQPKPAAAQLPAMHGWVQVDRRLTAWINERLRSQSVSPTEECQNLARRLGLEEINV